MISLIPRFELSGADFKRREAADASQDEEVNVVNLSAFTASKVNSSKGTRHPVRSLKGAPGRQSLAFEGHPEEVVAAALAWLEDADQYGPLELILGSETVMLVRKGSVEFIEAYRHSSPDEWYMRLPRDRARWWMLGEDAQIVHIGVLVAIVIEHRKALTQLVQDGFDQDSWRQNGFMKAMDEEKDGYYRALRPCL